MRDLDPQQLTGQLERLESSLLAWDFPAQVGAWFATYFGHGLCLFAIAAVAARVVRSARGTEQLWRAAMFGPLVTASLQLGAGFSPALGHWELPGTETLQIAADAATPWASTHEGSEFGLREAALQARLETLTEDLALLTGAEPKTAVGTPSAAPPRVLPDESGLAGLGSRSWGSLLSLFALSAGIAMLMLRALLEAIRMRNLGRPTRLMSGPVADTVRVLQERARIRRTIRVQVTEQGSSPYATGVLYPRVVLPRRALTELDRPSLRAMLAHEIGHVARFDPLWTAAARSVAALLFFQPLNWYMLRRLDESAEYCCDEFAVDVTGNEVALARCLTTVAEWIMGGPVGARAESRPACPMAHRRSPLSARVTRILATEGEPTHPLGLVRWVGGAAVLATAMAAPGFAAKKAELTWPGTQYELVEEPTPVPASPFEALIVSVDELQREILALVALTAEREVPDSTVRRLERLHQHALHARSVIEELENRMRQLGRQ